MNNNTNKLGEDLLQTFLELLAEAQSVRPSRVPHWRLLQSYAEVQFVLTGGRRCPVCNAHVRHVLPITAEHNDGTTVEFPCLCNRCFEAERAVSRVVTTHMGQTRVEHFPVVHSKRTPSRRVAPSEKERAKAAKKKTSD
jgi:hypothetical protein